MKKLAEGHVSVPDSLWESKYKALAEAYDKKEIPCDNSDFTTEDFLRSRESSNSHTEEAFRSDLDTRIELVPYSIDKEVFVPVIGGPSNEYAILDPENSYRSLEEVERISKAIKAQPMIELVAFKPSRILEHEIVVALSLSVQLSKTIGELDVGLEKKFDKLKKQAKTESFLNKCENYRSTTTELLGKITQGLKGEDFSVESIRGLKLEDQDREEVERVIKTLYGLEEDFNKEATTEVKTQVIIDKMTNQFFRDEAKSSISKAIEAQIEMDVKTVKDYFKNKIGEIDEPLEWFRNEKSSLEESLNEKKILSDYLKEVDKIREGYSSKADQVKYCRELLKKHLGDASEKYGDGFIECYLDRNELVEKYFLPITKRKLSERLTLTVNGGIASGKGSSVHMLEYRYEYSHPEDSRNSADNIKINGDSLKVLLNPSYVEEGRDKKKFSQLVQPEVTWIGNEIFNRIRQDIKDGKDVADIIIDKVMLPVEWIETAIAAEGSLEGIMVSTAVDTVIPRAYERGKQIGRFEATKGILSTHQGSVPWLENVIKQFAGKNITYEIYDNNVEKGQQPILIGSIECEDNVIEIHDRGALEKFLIKKYIDIDKTLDDTSTSVTNIKYKEGRGNIVEDFIQENRREFREVIEYKGGEAGKEEAYEYRNHVYEIELLKSPLDRNGKIGKEIERLVNERLRKGESSIKAKFLYLQDAYKDPTSILRDMPDLKKEIMKSIKVGNYFDISKVPEKNKENAKNKIARDMFNKLSEKVSVGTGSEVSESYLSALLKDIILGNMNSTLVQNATDIIKEGIEELKREMVILEEEVKNKGGEVETLEKALEDAKDKAERKKSEEAIEEAKKAEINLEKARNDLEEKRSRLEDKEKEKELSEKHSETLEKIRGGEEAEESRDRLEDVKKRVFDKKK